MFDLNDAVGSWRTGLSAGNACGRQDLDELEGHLREEIDHLKGLGLSEQEAFLVGVHRLGSVGALTLEYAKVYPHRPWMQRLAWAAAGVLVFILLNSVAGMATAAGMWVGAVAGVGGYGLGVIGVCARFCTLAAACGAIGYWCSVGRVAVNGGPRPVGVGNWVLVAMSISLVVGASFGSMAFQIMMARMIGPRDMGTANIAQAYANFAWQLVLPVLLIVLIIWVRRRSCVAR